MNTCLMRGSHKFSGRISRSRSGSGSGYHWSWACSAAWPRPSLSGSKATFGHLSNPGSTSKSMAMSGATLCSRSKSGSWFRSFIYSDRSKS